MMLTFLDVVYNLFKKMADVIPYCAKVVVAWDRVVAELSIQSMPCRC